MWTTPNIAQVGKIKTKTKKTSVNELTPHRIMAISLPFNFSHIQKTYAYDTFAPYVRSESF